MTHQEAYENKIREILQKRGLTPPTPAPQPQEKTK